VPKNKSCRGQPIASRVAGMFLPIFSSFSKPADVHKKIPGLFWPQATPVIRTIFVHAAAQEGGIGRCAAGVVSRCRPITSATRKEGFRCSISVA
jgi:hypothetical protein